MDISFPVWGMPVIGFLAPNNKFGLIRILFGNNRFIAGCFLSVWLAGFIKKCTKRIYLGPNFQKSTNLALLINIHWKFRFVLHPFYQYSINIMGGDLLNKLVRLEIQNSKAIKICLTFGTRPEAIKMAPVFIALNGQPEFRVKTVVTAQHREMLDQVLELFGWHPDYDLDIMTPGQTLTEVTCRILERLTPILQNERPDLILVHGDTTTTFAASLAAFYQKIPVAHVEAGLRTGDPSQPYPEEMNRVLTGHLAALHFAPTTQARANLLQENIQTSRILVTGNTVIDALQYCRKLLPRDENESTERLILVTAHRRENWGRPLENIIVAFKHILEAHPEVRFLIPMHRNPVVREIFRRELGNDPRVRLIEPLEYREMVAAMNQAYLVITDSGGIQEEAPALGKPVLVLRDKTERPEAVTAGTVKLVGTDPERIWATADLLLRDSNAYQRMARAVNPYGDGFAAKRILAGLCFSCGISNQLPEEFTGLQ